MSVLQGLIPAGSAQAVVRVISSKTYIVHSDCQGSYAGNDVTGQCHVHKGYHLRSKESPKAAHVLLHR